MMMVSWNMYQPSSVTVKFSDAPTPKSVPAAGLLTMKLCTIAGPGVIAGGGRLNTESNTCPVIGEPSCCPLSWSVGVVGIVESPNVAIMPEGPLSKFIPRRAGELVRGLPAGLIAIEPFAESTTTEAVLDKSADKILTGEIKSSLIGWPTDK
jgi:hypothetical protein